MVMLNKNVNKRGGKPLEKNMISSAKCVASREIQNSLTS